MTGKVDHPGSPAMPNRLSVELCGKPGGRVGMSRCRAEAAKLLNSRSRLNPRRMVCPLVYLHGPPLSR